MTAKMSRHRITMMLKGYFRGLPQVVIAGRVGVDQASVSHYASRFKNRAAKIGVLAAGKEFQVFNEVDEIRALSVELAANGLTASEAKEGVKILKAFIKLGVSPEKHAVLVKVCQEMGNPGFLQAAVKLKQIEDEIGMTFEEVVPKLQVVAQELPATEKQLKERKAELDSLNHSLAQRKKDMASQELMIKNLGVQAQEVLQAAKLRAEVKKLGLDIPTLVKLAKEFGNGGDKV